MRYACPSCGRWVRPLVEVTAVTCLHCGVYAQRQEEEQPALLTGEDLEAKPPTAADRERPDQRPR